MPEDRPKNRRRDPQDRDIVCGSSAVEVRGSPTSANGATGTAWEPTPWRAVQRAAWDPLRKAEEQFSNSFRGSGLA